MSTMEFDLYPNPSYGHGTPSGEQGTVLIYGRRLTAVRQAWHMGRVWVQRVTDPTEWFKASAPTRDTFEGN